MSRGQNNSRSSENPSSSSSSSSVSRWLPWCGGALIGAWMLRSLLRGTAPQPNSTYQAFKAAQQQHVSHQTGSGSRMRQERWDRAQYAYRRWEQSQHQSSYYGSSSNGRSRSSGDEDSHEWESDMRREQLRAEQMQARYQAKQRLKRILPYEQWRGGKRTHEESEDEDEEHEYTHGQAFAYEAMQRQLATCPKFIQARQLLFGGEGTTATAASSSSSSSSFASPSFSPISSAPHHPSSSSSSFPPLTLASVRTAYYSRAKELHPDTGGDRHRFQQLTDAYDTLTQALITMEGKGRKTSEMKQ